MNIKLFFEDPFGRSCQNTGKIVGGGEWKIDGFRILRFNFFKISLQIKPLLDEKDSLEVWYNYCFLKI